MKLNISELRILNNEIQVALSDPVAPWYGSDLVPQVGDLCEATERAFDIAVAAKRCLEARVGLVSAFWELGKLLKDVEIDDE